MRDCASQPENNMGTRSARILRPRGQRMPAMIDDTDVTPIERPLLRSDLHMVRIELEGVKQAMRAIQQLSLAHYSQASATRREGRILSFVCIASAIISLGCAMIGASH